jgi:Domain of unknown function (DUF4157)
MALQSLADKKPTHDSGLAPVQNALQSRPFAPQADPEQAQTLPDLQTQIENAQRFGHHLGKNYSLSAPSLPSSPPLIQAKLTIGAPGDKYEQEADRVAQQVVQRLNAHPVGRTRPDQTVQRETQPEEEEELQMKPLAGQIQREEMPDEEELQMKPNLLQREEMPEGDEELQMKPLVDQIQREDVPEEEEELQMKPDLLQRETQPEEDEELQMKPLADQIQREDMPEEEELQMKPLRMRGHAMEGGEASTDLESAINGARGGGQSLDAGLQQSMGQAMGADFSGVRVHTDAQADQLNRSIQAKAFTTGQDVFFRQGEYNPGSQSGQELIAHELTHVVQQTGAKQLQRRPIVRSGSNKLQTKSLINISAPPTLAKTIQRKSAPTSHQADPAFQAVKQKVTAEANKQKAHPPAKAKATEAQAAAVPPANEKESKAQDRHVQEMNQQKPGQFNTAAFKAALIFSINAATPQNLDQADKFKDNNKLGAVKSDLSSQVGNEKKQAAGPIEAKTKEPPKTGGIPDKAVTPLPPPPPGAPPSDIGASQAVPKPKDASEVSMQAGSQSLDQQMTDAKITDEQLAKSNEPEFKAALGDKKKAQTDAAKAPSEYRQKEQATLAQAQTQAQKSAQAHLQGMQGQKAQVLSQVMGQQGTTKGKDEQKRGDIAGYIEGVYNQTKQKVKELLDPLDGEVNQEFDRGASAAKSQFDTYVDQEMTRFKDKRYSGLTGKALWVKDLFLPLPDEVNSFYQAGRKKYIDSMTATIDRVANLVVTKLNAAKTEIAKGKQEIQKYVAGLDPSLRQVGQDAAQNIQGKFEQLEQSVDSKQGELIDSLAEKYNENLQTLDADIEKRKSENQGLVGKAKAAIGGVIQTILELKNMLMGMLAKAAGAVEKIIKDPVGFLSNLVAGIKQGFMGFVSNITEHLKKGLIGWLTGSLAGAGIEMPKSFDLKGIFVLVTSVLGLTYAGMRERVANKVGEKKVSALEKGFDMFILWKNEGMAGLWKFIQDKLANLKEMVIDGIQSFVIDTIISAGVTWVLSLLNPASAFVRACKLIVDVIMFFVEKGSQIAELVNAVLDSVGAIADGAIGVAAKLVEGALAKALPVVIGFLASLIGLGGISGKIRGLIEKARGLIDTAVNWVLSKAFSFVKKLGFGKKDKKDRKEKEGEKEDPNHDRKVAAGLAAIDSEEQSYMKDGKISQEDAKKVVAKVKTNHSIFKSLTVADGGDSWDYDYVASPNKRKKGEKKRVVDLSSLTGWRPSWRKSTDEALAAKEENKPYYHIRQGKLKLKKKENVNRRHKVSFEVIVKDLRAQVDGKTYEKGHQVLSNLGYQPSKLDNNAITSAGRKYLRDKFNDPKNIWVGDAQKNQELGQRISALMRDLKTAQNELHSLKGQAKEEIRKRRPVIISRITSIVDQLQAARLDVPRGKTVRAAQEYLDMLEAQKTRDLDLLSTIEIE